MLRTNWTIDETQTADDIERLHREFVERYLLNMEGSTTIPGGGVGPSGPKRSAAD